jgi:hypothetical protein
MVIVPFEKRVDIAGYLSKHRRPRDEKMKESFQDFGGRVKNSISSR